jgi:hypothetical protein
VNDDTTWLQTEHGEILCPLPVLRNVSSNDPNSGPNVVVEPCRATVWLTREQAGDLSIDGIADDYTRSWKVECLGGHVLIVNDDEDMSPTVEPAPELIARALRQIAGLPGSQ